MKKYLSILAIGLVALLLIFLQGPESSSEDQAPLHSEKPVEKLTLSQPPASWKEVLKLAENWEQTSLDPSQKDRIIQSLEQFRRDRLELMQEDPHTFLETAFSLKNYAALPEELKPYVGRPYSAVGTMRTAWATSIAPDGSLHCEDSNRFTTDSETLEVIHPDGHLLPARRQQAVNGYHLGNQLLLTDQAVKTLSTSEAQAAAQLFPTGNPDGLDPLTGRTGKQIPALLGGKLYTFSNEEIPQMVDAELQKEGTGVFDWMAGDSSGNPGSGSSQATPYQDDQINVLMIRLSFPDMAPSPVTKTDLQTSLSSVNSKIADYSYGLAGLTYTVSDNVYTLPSDGSYYAASFSRNDELHEDARVLATADYTLTNYDVIAVFFPSLTGVTGSEIIYGGFADIGSRVDGSSLWINGSNNVEIIFHEFGHSYGLYHANYLHPEMELELAQDYDLPGILEYGDIFDTMGDGNSPEAHFNPLAKNQLQWIPDSKIAEAGANGTWRISRFDDLNALSNATLALKVPMAGNVNYWVGFRQLYTSSTYNLANAAYVVGENMGQGRETALIDMTPESEIDENDDRQDAGLPVGGSYYDSSAGVTFEALATGGSDPNQWIDVQITFDPRIGFQDSLLEVDEQAGTISIPVTRTFSSQGGVSVDFTTSDGTATAPGDYYASSGTLSWSDGDTDDKNIVISLRPDILNEGSEDLTLTLSSPAGGVLDTGRSSLTVKILDPGQRYTTFAPPFFNTAVNAIVPLDNGQIIIGGIIGSGIGDFDSLRNIARLNADGSVDSSFTTGNGFNGEVSVIVKEDGGSLLVSGDFTTYDNVACPGLVRLSASGVLDTAFVSNLGSGTNDTIRSISIENDGGILLGGDFSSFNSVNAEGLIRLNANGTRNTVSPLNLPFETSWNTEIHTVTVENDGKIMAGGYFYITPTATGFGSGIARLLPNGGLDTSFDPDAGAHADGSINSPQRVFAIQKQHDGKYLIEGTFTAYDENQAQYIARIHNNGTFDSTFNPPSFNASPTEALIQANDRLVLAGNFTSPARGVERLETSGVVDTTFYQQSGISFNGANPNIVRVYALAEDAEGQLWLGGNFFSYQGITTRPVIRIAGGVSPYQLWVQENFTSAQIIAGVTDPDDDPDNDDIVNLAELAMGTDPNVSTAANAFAVDTASGIEIVESGGQSYLQISLTKPANPDGPWYTAQFSGDLNTWSPASPTPGSNEIIIVENSATRFTVRDTVPITSANPRFGRILLQSPE